MGLQGAEDDVRVGFEDYGRLAQAGVLGLLKRGGLAGFGFGEELAAVIVDGVLRVFEGVAGEDEDNALLAGYFSLCYELFEAGKGDC